MTAPESLTLLTLPTEIRLQILDYVFESSRVPDGLCGHGAAEGVKLVHEYTASSRLRPLLTCRRLFHDGQPLAFGQTTFVCANLFVDIPSRLAGLDSKSVASLKRITFVADARHFRKLIDWGSHPFASADLQLDYLGLILHRSSCWHYLFDFTADIVQLLRELSGVRNLVFVCNGARVKGSFKTWCNRLIGLVMKVDHHERYLAAEPKREKVWWTWKFDDLAQSISFDACQSKPWEDEETYLQRMLPLVESLSASIETEEWNPDPRSRNGA